MELGRNGPGSNPRPVSCFTYVTNSLPRRKPIATTGPHTVVIKSQLKFREAERCLLWLLQARFLDCSPCGLFCRGNSSGATISNPPSQRRHPWLLSLPSPVAPCQSDAPGTGRFLCRCEGRPDGGAPPEGNLDVTKILHLCKHDVTTRPDTTIITISEDTNQ